MVHEELKRKADVGYQLAEQRAYRYFQTLSVQLEEKAYVPNLIKSFQLWKKQQTRHQPLLSFFPQRKWNVRPIEYRNYIQWLNNNERLDDYLERSISYIFIRDLGRTVESPITRKKIQHVMDKWKNYFSHSTENEKEINMIWLYQFAKKEGVESTFIWLLDKLKSVKDHMPKEMDKEEGIRKLIKIIAGVIMQALDELGREVSPQERTQKLEKAIKTGYSYGLTYPFIDDLLDANILSPEEKRQYSTMIRSTLITGIVPEFEEWPEKNRKFIRYIYAELKAAFAYLKVSTLPNTWNSLLEQSYVFFTAQEVDRAKKLSNETYTNEELYIPVILKSASSRLIIRSLINTSMDEDINNRLFFYGIYNQLSDDFTDMFDDLQEGRVTPYTYYLTHHQKRVDLINPFELYWVVIMYLVHEVYHSDKKTCEVILSRAINSQKRFKARMGAAKYAEVMGTFTIKHEKIHILIQQMVQKGNDVDFFDKLLRDYMITMLKRNRKEQEELKEMIQAARNEIDQFLPINKNNDTIQMGESIIDAVNYSLKGSGKRIRPIITWVMGVKEYGLESSTMIPLLKSLEYMHTASLIFDDLPSQDNALLRRGRPTVHQVYNIATAELAGLFLTQKAVEEQSSLHGFEAEKVLRLINYSARVTMNICRGQAMDLDSKGKTLTLDQLNTLSKYKTALGFEAALVMPAILAGRKENEIQALKNVAYHAGVAFQIKDDLLDVEGESDLLGKQTNKDQENNHSTFVSTLGKGDAKKAMWEHYSLATEILEDIPQNTPFLKHLLRYFIHRDY